MCIMRTKITYWKNYNTLLKIFKCNILQTNAVFVAEIYLLTY